METGNADLQGSEPDDLLFLFGDINATDSLSDSVFHNIIVMYETLGQVLGRKRCELQCHWDKQLAVMKRPEKPREMHVMLICTLYIV